MLEVAGNGDAIPSDATPVLRALLPLIPAVAVAWAVDRASDRAPFRPPGFDNAVRRAAMLAILAVIFYFGTFLPMAFMGQEIPFDPKAVGTVDLFLLHAVLVVGLGGWFALGYSGLGGGLGGIPTEDPAALGPLPEEPSKAGRELLRQCGLAPKEPLRETVFGLTISPFLWLAILVTMAVFAKFLQAAGAGDWLPQEISPMISFMAGLPVAVRLALSLSAGVVEEVFFRGFLQRRLGVWLSSALFVLAHLSYGQPVMLVGIALLSLSFAGLTRWRGNVLPAVVAHTFFDAAQLLWLIPSQVTSSDPLASGIC